MSGPDDALVDALERAKRRGTWTQRLVQEHASRPAELKGSAFVCSQCPRPCEDDEVCATAIVRESSLDAEVDRDQAFHHVESGMRRLQTVGLGSTRTTDGDRPNTFVSVTDEGLTDEGLTDEGRIDSQRGE